MSQKLIKICNESFLDFALRIITDENIKEYGLQNIYNSLFDTDVSYDNAQRQLLGIRKFLNQYKMDLIDNESKNLDNNISNKELDLSINADGTQTRNALLELSEDIIKTPSLLLEAHGYNPKEWQLVNSKNSMWHQNSNKDGLKTLYCSKITVKPKTEISLEDVEEIFEKLDRKNKTANISTNNEKIEKETSECFILNLFDVHFSKLAHSAECKEDYDYKIAKKRMMDSVKGYINRFNDRYFETIYFAIGQDFFNSEPDGCTVGNTRQDNDSRYYVMFEKGVETLIEIIDTLKQNCLKIYVPLVQGNHSTYTEYYAAQFLKAWYKDDYKVIVDAGPTPRKYYQFGKNLFGFTHNSEEKNRLQTLMQVEAPKMWADTEERTWFTGHLHCEDVKEAGGIFIRQAPTICSSDAWHTKKGYVGTINRSQGFIYDEKDGLVESHYIKIQK